MRYLSQSKLLFFQWYFDCLNTVNGRRFWNQQSTALSIPHTYFVHIKMEASAESKFSNKLQLFHDICDLFYIYGKWVCKKIFLYTIHTFNTKMDAWTILLFPIVFKTNKSIFRVHSSEIRNATYKFGRCAKLICYCCCCYFSKDL